MELNDATEDGNTSKFDFHYLVLVVNQMERTRLSISISYFNGFWNGAASEERGWDGRVGVNVD